MLASGRRYQKLAVNLKKRKEYYGRFPALLFSAVGFVLYHTSALFELKLFSVFDPSLADLLQMCHIYEEED